MYKKKALINIELSSILKSMKVQVDDHKVQKDEKKDNFSFNSWMMNIFNDRDESMLTGEVLSPISSLLPLSPAFLPPTPLPPLSYLLLSYF
jgi:hypothetical protein